MTDPNEHFNEAMDNEQDDGNDEDFQEWLDKYCSGLPNVIYIDVD